MKDCKFCAKKIRTSGVAYDSKACFAIPSEYPISRGHMLIISKEHYEDMLSVSSSSACEMFNAARKIAEKIRKELKPSGIKIISNVAGAEEISHAHIHIIPKYPGSNDEILPFREFRELTQKEKKGLVKKLKL